MSDVHPPIEKWGSAWSRFWEERSAISLGLVAGSATSALFPLIVRGTHLVKDWVSDPQNVDGNAKPVALAAILLAVVLIWVGPWIRRLAPSLWRGVSRGSFGIPAVLTFVALGMRYPLPLVRYALSPLQWWISVVLIVSLGTMILLEIFKRSFSKPLTADKSDEERTSIKDAWPERRELSERIANCVAVEGKATYAIYGDFGSGKSSMMNFVTEQLRSRPHPKPVIVRFNAWLPGSQDSLVDHLLSDIATECSKRYYLPQLRRSARKVARAVVSGVPHFSGLAEWLSDDTQRKLIEHLGETLERIPARVVVLVDEIDRMRKEELFVLLKMIRGFSSLPRVTFVCALERDHVEKLIRQEFGTVDHSFYHKFFVESFHLPRLVDSYLESVTRDELIAVFDKGGWFKQDAQSKQDYSNAIHTHWESVFAPLCTNARAIKRLVSCTRMQAQPLLGEVNPFDLTLVSALRYFAPRVLDLIWDYQSTLCAPDVNSNLVDPDKIYAAEVARYFQEEDGLLDSSELKTSVQRIREVLFSGLERVRDAQTRDERTRTVASTEFFQQNRLGAKTNRLRSMSYFPAYFQDVLPTTIFPERDLSQLLEELRGSTHDLQGSPAVLKAFKALAGEGTKRMNFLDKLNDKAARTLDLEKCAWITNVLVSNSCRIDDPAYEEEYTRIVRLVARVGDEFFKGGKPWRRLQLFRESILAARADGVALGIFQWASTGRPFPENLTEIEPVRLEELALAFITHMENYYGPTKDPDHVDLRFSYWQAFAEWGKMLRQKVWAEKRDTQKSFWLRYISSPSRMADFARYVVEPFLIFQQRPGQHSYSIEDVLAKEDVRVLAQEHPPTDDQVAAQYINTILGEPLIPPPLRMGE
jgi:hypothetical protein